MFQTMERRLLRAIMNPSMMATWVFGLALVFTPGIVDWSMRLALDQGGGACCGMTWFHHWLGRAAQGFRAGANPISGRQYRLMNEVPTVLMVVIVFR